MRSNRKKKFFEIVIFLTIAVAGFGKAVQELWNWLMPIIFGLTAITFWQAVGLLALSWLLLGGWRGMRRPGHREQWRGRMPERWEQMTPEERDKFRTAIRRRC